MSGETLPQKMLESIFRYASMRAQWRNSRLTLILESLGVLEVCVCVVGSEGGGVVGG